MLPDKKKKQIIASTFQALLGFFPYFPSRLNYFLLVMVSRKEIFPIAVIAVTIVKYSTKLDQHRYTINLETLLNFLNKYILLTILPNGEVKIFTLGHSATNKVVIRFRFPFQIIIIDNI